MSRFDRTLIIKRAVTDSYQYDDEGYCDTKILYGGSIYWAGVADGNGELMCAECMLQTLITQLSATGTIPEYKDNWQAEWKEYTKRMI